MLHFCTFKVEKKVDGFWFFKFYVIWVSTEFNVKTMIYLAYFCKKKIESTNVEAQYASIVFELSSSNFSRFEHF